MKTSPLLDRSRTEIKLGDYRVAAATALNDPTYLSRVQEYRRLASSRMYPLDRDDIQRKVAKADYFVSKKIDGEFTVLIFDGTDAVTLNPGGTVRTGLPVTQEAARLLTKANIKHALIVGELYVGGNGKRTRVHDIVTVARQPQSEADLKRIHFSVFDIIPWDGPAPESYAETWKTIQELFGKGERITPVETQKASGPEQIKQLFEKWVEGDGAEGIVARSDSAGLFKIKPRHTLDVVVLGFTESVGDREGMLHDLLFGIMRRDGTFQVLSRVGGGFDEDQRRTMLCDLKDRVVKSEYAEVNSDHVAYQMVRPEWVIEISCLDLIAQTTRGASVNRVVLDYQSDGYRVVRRMPLATVISPQFLRRREDKSARYQDVRIDQVSSIVEVAQWDSDARALATPKSQILRREVYTKIMKGETMVRKFLMLKTNKEGESQEYPAYVLHYTDFSPSRKTPLDREVRVSSSREQMDQLWKDMIEENVKKGWELHSKSQEESTPGKETVAVISQTPGAENAANALLETAVEIEPAAKPKKRAPAKKSSSEESQETDKPTSSRKKPAAKSEETAEEKEAPKSRAPRKKKDS